MKSLRQCFWCGTRTAVIATALASQAVYAQSGDCANLSNNINTLNQQIASSNIASDRRAREQVRDNYVQLYNRLCTGGAAARGGGTPYSNANRSMQAFGLGMAILGAARDYARSLEAQERQAYDRQRSFELQQEMHRIQQQSEELERQRRAEEDRERNKRLQEENERLAQRKDQAARQALTNPFGGGGPERGENPFSSGVSGDTGSHVPQASAHNPFASTGSSQGANSAAFAESAVHATAPNARISDGNTAAPQARALGGEGALGGAARPAIPGERAGSPAPSPIRPGQAPRDVTHQQIAAFCAGAPNPRACETSESEARDRGVGRYRASEQQAVQRQREVDHAQQELRRAMEEFDRQKAASLSASNSATQRNSPSIGGAPNLNVPVNTAGNGGAGRGASEGNPVSPPGTAPHFVSGVPFEQNIGMRERGGESRPIDADLARCREGAAAPETVAGCYEMRLSPTPQTTPSNQMSARERLRRSLDARRLRGDARGNAPDSDNIAELEEDPAVASGAMPPPSTRNLDSDKPPDGFSRQVMVSEDLCRHWNGRYHSPGHTIVPVCDFPIQRLTIEGSETDLAVRELIQGFSRSNAGP